MTMRSLRHGANRRRRGLMPVSTILRKSVMIFNITQKPEKGVLRELKISKMSLGKNGPTPLCELVSFRSALVNGYLHYCFVYFRSTKIVQKRPEKKKNIFTWAANILCRRNCNTQLYFYG